MSLADTAPPPAPEAAASTAPRPGRPLPGILYCAGLGAAVYLAIGDGQALHWDNPSHNLPLYLEAFRQLRSGVLPAWNPFIWSGAPLLADPQSQAAYPLTWLACLLAGARPTDIVCIAYALQVVLAAAGMYLLARSLDMSTAGALLAASVFAVNPYSVFLGTGFFNEFATVAWLPWIVLCVRRASVPSCRPFRWVAGGAAAAAAAWCAGYPQLWAYGTVVAIGCGFAFSSGSGGRGAVLAALVLFAGLGLVMFQFLPFIVLWRESQRAIPLRIDQFLASDVPMAAWPALFTPGLLGQAAAVFLPLTANNLVHLGLVPMTLALIALARPSRSRVVLCALALAGLWLASGRQGRLLPLLYGVPGMSLLRGPYKFFPWAIYGFAVLAGFGLTDIQRDPRRWHGIVVLCGILLVTAIWVTRPPSLAPFKLMAGQRPAWAFSVSVVTALAFGTQVARRANKSRTGWSAGWTGALAIAGIAAVFAIEFAAYSSPQLPVAFTRAPADPGAVVPLRETGERRALYAASDGWRTYSAFTRLAPTWAGDIRGALAVYWRVEAASGYSAFLDPAYATAISYDPVGEPARLGGMRRRALQDRNRVLDVLSVRYVLLPNNSVTDRLLTRTRTRGGPEHYVKRTLDERLAVLVNELVLPRVRFVRRAEGVTRRADALRALVHGRVDPAETVLVEGDAGGSGRVGLQPCSKSVARPAPGRVELDVHCPGDAFAVFAERADRGWEATVDGVRAPLVRSYGLVLGLPLHRGAHRVVLRYRPPGFRLGMALAAATALTLAAGMVSERGSPGG